MPPKSCAGCGAPLEQKKTGRPAKWCSDRCRKAAETRVPVDSVGEGVADLDETLLMLSQAARKGAVSAMTSLLKYHMDVKARNADEDKPDDPFAGLDELAERRQAS